MEASNLLPYGKRDEFLSGLEALSEEVEEGREEKAAAEAALQGGLVVGFDRLVSGTRSTPGCSLLSSFSSSAFSSSSSSPSRNSLELRRLQASGPERSYEEGIRGAQGEVREGHGGERDRG